MLVRGDTVSEFETYVFSLEEGELCPVPIETRYGVHIIALDRKIVGQELSFDVVRSQIGRYLREASAQVAARLYLMRLIGRAKIEGFEMKGAESVLVQ
jgi:peptidyl-prolyl cis-trans isomerase C